MPARRASASVALGAALGEYDLAVLGRVGFGGEACGLVVYDALLGRGLVSSAVA